MKNKRRKESVKSGIRKHLVPDIDSNATKTSELCQWEDAAEPSITIEVDDVELNGYTSSPLELNIPCYTQAVEREVKLATEASAAVARLDNQQGFAFNIIAARKADL